MIKTEKQLWGLLKKAFPRNGEIKLDRIETSTRNGVPDICYTNGIINGWIELKVPKMPNITQFGLSPNQIIWLKEHPQSFVLLAAWERFLFVNSFSFHALVFNNLDFYQNVMKFGINFSRSSSVTKTLHDYIIGGLNGEKTIFAY